MKVISMLHQKGGVGKTVLSHGLALGACWLGHPSYLFHTDNRKPMEAFHRPYTYVDAQNPVELESKLAGLHELSPDTGYLVIDGGGNKEGTTLWLAQKSDLVLIPIDQDDETVDLGNKLMGQLEEQGVEARFLLNEVPGGAKARSIAFEEYYGRVDQDKVIGELGIVGAMRKLKRADTDPVNGKFKTPDTKVNNLSRKLFRLVASTIDETNDDKASSPTKAATSNLDGAVNSRDVASVV